MSAREDGATQPEDRSDEKFVPRGAIAFMVFMVVAYGLVWFLFFFLMLDRS